LPVRACAFRARSRVRSAGVFQRWLLYVQPRARPAAISNAAPPPRTHRPQQHPRARHGRWDADVSVTHHGAHLPMVTMLRYAMRCYAMLCDAMRCYARHLWSCHLDWSVPIEAARRPGDRQRHDASTGTASRRDVCRSWCRLRFVPSAMSCRRAKTRVRT
jgi:hypothetical protein